MNKIICDVCGTSYPEVSGQCPICGFAKPSTGKTTADGDGASGAYQHVRGGRFSAANVRKRNAEKGIAPVQPVDVDVDEEKPAKKGSNFSLGMVAIVLLIILIGVLGWFIIGIVLDRTDALDNAGDVATEQSSQLRLELSSVTLKQPGEKFIIHASMIPSDPNAHFRYFSQNPAICTVDDYGTVTAVAEGETVVTVSCGDLWQRMYVTCNFSAPPATETTAPAQEVLQISLTELTLSELGATYDLYLAECNIPREDITWQTGDAAVATVEAGVVTSVASGETTVHAIYNDQMVSCTVRCELPAEETEPTQPSIPKQIVQSHKDVTIAVNETFLLQLKDVDGNVFDVTWTAAQEGIVTINGDRITGAKAGEKTELTCTLGDQTYVCVVRVKIG